jgi:UDP-N-acetylglucosamine:LPS N-acetylglucosamine transferase
VSKNKEIQICLVASAGGHLSQLLKLKLSWQGHETFCVTTTKVIQRKFQRTGQIYVVGECNRRSPLRVLKVLLRCILPMLKGRPDVVISTGAAVGCICCFLGKIVGAKIIWIDSITNTKKLSLSGLIVKPISDLFLVQRKELAEKYKNVEYRGSII